MVARVFEEREKRSRWSPATLKYRDQEEEEGRRGQKGHEVFCAFVFYLEVWTRGRAVALFFVLLRDERKSHSEDRISLSMMARRRGAVMHNFDPSFEYVGQEVGGEKVMEIMLCLFWSMAMESEERRAISRILLHFENGVLEGRQNGHGKDPLPVCEVGDREGGRAMGCIHIS